MSDTTTVQSEGFTVTSNSETAEQIAANEAPPKETAEKPEEKTKETPAKVAKAAAELGKLGGAASAAKRAEAKAQETPEETPAAEGEAQDVEAAPEKPLGKPRDDPRARMLEATRKEAEAKRLAAAAAERAERAERRLAELERAAAPKAPEGAQKPSVAPTGDEKPKVEDFEDYSDFVEARSRWAAREEWREQSKRAAVQAQAQNYVQKLDGLVSKYNERLAEATKGDPDFMGKLSPEVSELRPTFTLDQGQRPGPLNLMADEILSSERAPALMLHLTEHPDVFQRIAALRTPQDVLREMAKLEARLDAAPTATAPALVEVSKAKPPVRPVAGSPHSVDSAPGDDAPYEEHKRYWNARDKQASRR